MNAPMRMPLYAGLGLGAAIVLTASGLLWLRAGERVYFDKILAGIAGCF
ncbi:hypothetical protein JM93_02908 [Roseibium hamelinense]|uniref:Uncharacterized protein n=1 Tax=Roseibium hamelinense TaxID=150831 RepID=A0A562SV46_9HYPH|nr:hypothetical protein [Roseibium hamelinense]TWI84576.1 hypothetical protein JM93_02908 [Roseibium hamelinense]